MVPYSGRDRVATDAFRDKIALVTGGASGIGRELGRQLVERGARVWLADVDPDAARAAAEQMQGPGVARALAVDVRDAASVEAVVARVCEEDGCLDLMFNNAGIALFGDARHMALGDWNDLIDVNLRGVVHGLMAAYPRMARQGHGHIVNTASAAGLIPVPTNSAYAMTKHGVVGLSTSLRYEAEQFGVRISAVCPGVIETPIVERMKVLELAREELLAEAPPLYPVEKCVRSILRGVERNRALIVVTPLAHVLWRLHRFAPRLLALLLRRSMRRNPFFRN